ncbi:hypothetical protein APHNP_1669 [Anaplasma phagocytophilum str. ApNP]|uniref:Uncharacterized protein n=1 Tax=Anaplasma phagocytophilum str. ApNP TaxID=1359153 RepID=A0A0F3NHW3_ANAPH|nr:hypothetical protein APHNP_1669 [Anaplasma phagocytophilum str. ApNP]
MFAAKLQYCRVGFLRNLRGNHSSINPGAYDILICGGSLSSIRILEAICATTYSEHVHIG